MDSHFNIALAFSFGVIVGSVIVFVSYSLFSDHRGPDDATILRLAETYIQQGCAR